LSADHTSNESGNSNGPGSRIAAIAFKVAGTIFDWIWRKLRVVFAYYWQRRRSFWRHFTEYARDLRPDRFVTREIRVSSAEEYLNAEYDGDQWKVRLPKLCVTCGTPVKGKAITERFEVENLTGPFWSVVLGTVFGFLLSLVYWSWFFPVGIIFGIAVGYGRHSMLDVEMRFWRCPKHTESPRFPKLRTFADFLIITVGSKDVRQAFRLHRKSNHQDPGVYHEDESLHADDDYEFSDHVPAPRPNLAPIPLAEEVHESVEPDEERDLLPPKENKDSQ